MSLRGQTERIPVLNRLFDDELSVWSARIFGIVVGYLLWYVVASLSPSSLIPHPIPVFEATWGLIVSGTGLVHLQATLYRTLISFVLAFLLGTSVGILIGVSDFWSKFGPVYVLIGISIPGVAWAAITTLVFGFSILAPVTAITLTAYPYVAINVWKGVEGLNADLFEMSDAFDVSFKDQLVHAVLLDIAPQLFVAVRYGLSICWKVTITAEFIAASSGIGYMVIQKYQVLDTMLVFAYVTLFMIFVLGVELLVIRPLERKIYKYRPEADIDIV